MVETKIGFLLPSKTTELMIDRDKSNPGVAFCYLVFHRSFTEGQFDLKKTSKMTSLKPSIDVAFRNQRIWRMEVVGPK